MRKTFTIFLITLLTIIMCPLFSFAEINVFDDENTDTILFMSDIHNTSENWSGIRIKALLPMVALREQDLFDQICNCGDMGSAFETDSGNFWKYTRKAIDEIDKCKYLKADKGIHIAGNHEWKNGKLSTTKYKTPKRIIKDVGDVISGDSYEIFCFASTSSGTKYTKDDYSKLDNYLKSVKKNKRRKGKTIFVISHYPLHKSSCASDTHDNVKDTVKILNKHGDDLNIVFVWGHNHTPADVDIYYDKVLTPVSYVQGENFHFKYVAAGVMSDNSNYYDTTPNIAAKCVVASINKITGEVNFRGYTNSSTPFTLMENCTKDPTEKDKDASAKKNKKKSKHTEKNSKKLK